MTASHRIRILTHDGQPLAFLDDYTRFEYARVLNDQGWFTIVTRPDLSKDYLNVDQLFEFYRQPEGGTDQLLMVGFLRYWEWFEESGQEFLALGGPDPIELLNRRPIAYHATEPQATKDQEADDMCKAIVRENEGALAGNDAEGRPRRFLADHFFVDPDASQCPTLPRNFAWRKMLPVLQEIAETSRHLGTPLYFDCVPVGDARFTFRTFTNVMGIDRTLSGGLQPIVFSKEAGTLAEPYLREDYVDEWNYVWGGGKGEGPGRVIDTENDLPRMARSIWNRREDFQDAREEMTTLGVASRAFQHMQDSRPRLIFRGRLLDTPRSRFGVDWNYGDKVSARYRGKDFDGIIRSIHISMNQDQKEDLSAGLEIERAFN